MPYQTSNSTWQNDGRDNRKNPRMPVTDDQIRDLLNQLETLVEKIKPLRNRAADLEAQLTQAQRDYDRELGVLNAQVTRLHGRKMALRTAMAGGPQRKPTPIQENEARPTPPPPEIDPRSDSPSPLPSQVDPREARKRALWKHLYFFLDTDQLNPDPEQVKTIQTINDLVNDGRRDVGDMLEVLVWGDIWKARTDWETVDEQALRLEEWRVALQHRLEYWERATGRLKMDPRQGLLKEMQKGSQEWGTYLRGLAEQQQRENDQLAREISILEDERRAKQAPRQHNER